MQIRLHYKQQQQNALYFAVLIIGTQTQGILIRGQLKPVFKPVFCTYRKVCP
jgi:hypothetical protein